MIIVYIFFVVLVGAWARSFNRSFLGYAFLSLIISPIITAIILLVLGNANRS
jgi:hypothetical protein